MPAFQINQIRRETIEVDDSNAISFLGPAGPRVLSTPQMIGYMEQTCRDLVLTMLDPGFDTVGTHVDVWHKAAAPMGAKVDFEAELLSVGSDNGKPRRVEFRVLATMGDKIIGEGTHQRAIIDVSRFRDKVVK
ncbi:MAG TPA: thioesterase family protein [Bryobacteraceae bacterium]|nr:thioesterase family protein [Bryobacteraceae bacterium]